MHVAKHFIDLRLQFVVIHLLLQANVIELFFVYFFGVERAQLSSECD